MKFILYTIIIILSSVLFTLLLLCLFNLYYNDIPESLCFVMIGIYILFATYIAYRFESKILS